ncbi:MAG: UDP-2,4-diacetamido-2,4,6-trideoxy-beta-L-altropyranose hydrolase [Clostridium sp.]|nr:UDP-2,4-diacetamido-2,4,6-trideoxy-beta-L-altropyranose hydrolase [Clostridium sp.]
MGTHRLVYIRTDGNAQIASGHLMRCFSVALACRQLGMDVRFLVSDRESFDLLKGIMASYHAESNPLPFCKAISGQTTAPPEKGGLSGFEKIGTILQLQTASYNQLERELPEVVSLLSAQIYNTAASPCNDASAFHYDNHVTNQQPVYFLDSYYVTESYLSALRPYAKIAYLDDLRLFDYPVDLLINYDVIPDSETASYKASYRNAGRLLLGAAYAPLRSQFQNRQISIKKQVENLLITTGGSDPRHFCLTFVQNLKTSGLADFFSANQIAVHIVIGKLNTDKNALYRYAEEFSFLCLHENVADMAALMLGCDLAVSAAGTTLYELCALGIPSLSFIMADNQQSAARAFEAAGAIPCAGDLRGDLNAVLQKIILFIKDYSSENTAASMSALISEHDSSYQKRKRAGNAMKALVDGNGAARIAKAVSEL